MDEFQGHSAPSSSSYPAHLESLSVTVPCKTASDALLATLSVSLREDLTSKVLDAFLELSRDPSFGSKDVTFHTSQDISRHISERRKWIAQKRSLAGSRSNRDSGLTRNVYGGVPHLIIDIVAQQLANEMVPFAELVDWDTNMYNIVNARCPREHDLLSMALVHRTWTNPVSRVLRTRVKLYESKNIQSLLLSPRMGPWLREIYFAESLEYENADETTRLLRFLLRNAPNLRKLAIRRWCRVGPRDLYNFNDLATEELANMHQLEALWLFCDRQRVVCFRTLCRVLPHLRSLRALHIRNWLGGAEERNGVSKELEYLLSTMSSSARLTTLSFVDGGLNEATALFLPWLLRDCPLTNLEVHTKDIYKLESGFSSPVFRGLLPFLSKIKTLRLHYSSFNEDEESRTKFLLRCTNLTTLSLEVSLYHILNPFPESVETLHVHYSTTWTVSDGYLYEMLKEQESLEKLRTLRLTKDPIHAIAQVMNLEGVRPEDAWYIDNTKRLCEEREIDLTNEYNFISFDELTKM